MRQSTRRTGTQQSGLRLSSSIAPGLEEWYNGHDPEVDIVFIHGLMGDGEKTWRGTDDDGRKLLPWPKTFLPSAIPRSRILTFGYDARIVNSDEIQGKVSVKSIRDHAKELVASFGHMRNQTDTTGRPIIFVCHSLGGLVCKDAIIFSTQGRDREDLVDFSQSTAGIVFMGTPHRGSAIADYASRFSGLVGSFKQTNLRLLQILRTESETLQRIHDDFCDVINVRRNGTDGHEIRVICFWEQLPSKNVGFIVPKESAVLPGYSDRGIEADHKSMTKFSSESDSGYQVLLQELKSIISKAMKRAVLPSTSRASFSKSSFIPPVTASVTTSSTPFFYVPYARNEFFVGRSSTLKQLNSWIGSPVENRQRGIHKRAALHGLGGIGKTQVAIEWAYEKRQGGEHLSIFWIHSSTAERFTEAYTSIAREFQIPGHSCSGPDLLRLVKEWLESSHQQHPWLMIVDNADDIEVFIEKSEDSGYQTKMHQYLPVSPNGSILFTSRSKQAAVDLTESRSLIAVTEPSPEECVELFRRRLPASFYTETDIERFANELGYLPLALSQAISYLQKKSLSVSHYLEMLGQSSEDSLMGMLQDEFTEAGRDSASGNQIPNAVARTWLVSFRAIERDNSLAIQILYLCGCFDRQEIPRSLMVEYTRSYESINAKLLEKKVGIDAKGNRSDSDDTHQLRRRDKIKDLLRHTLGLKTAGTRALLVSENQKAPETPKMQPRNSPYSPTIQDLNDSLSLLIGYSFLTKSRNDRVEDITFTLHRLVHLVIQWELRRSGHIAKYLAMSMLILHAKTPELSIATTPCIRKFIPHIDAALGYEKDLIQPSWYWPALSKAYLLLTMTWFMLFQATPIDKVTNRCLAGIKLFEETIGPTHLDTIDMKRLCGSYLNDDGVYEEAAEILESCLDSLSEIDGGFGSVLAVASELSLSYRCMNRHDEAAQMLDKSIDRYFEQQPDVIATDTEKFDLVSCLISLSDRSNLMAWRGHLDEALVLARWALYQTRQVDVNYSQYPLDVASDVLAAIGGCENETEALAMRGVAVQCSSQIFGAHHPLTLKAIDALEHLNAVKAMGYPLYGAFEASLDMAKAVEQRKARHTTLLLASGRQSPQSAEEDGNRGRAEIDAGDREPPPSESQFVMGIINEYRQGKSDMDTLPEDDWKRSWAWTHYEPYRQLWSLAQKSNSHTKPEEAISQTPTYGQEVEGGDK